VKKSKSIWARYFLTAAVLISAFAWLPCVFLDVVDQELASRQAREQRERLSEAIWRLDLWLTPLLGIEAARPVSDYSPDLQSTVNLTQNDTGQLESRSGLAMSPLYRAPSEYFRLHFEFRPPPAKSSESALIVCSPYLPNDQEQAAYLLTNRLVTKAELSGNHELLDSTAKIFADPKLLDRFRVSEARTEKLLSDLPDRLAPPTRPTSETTYAEPDQASSPQDQGSADWTTRAQRTKQSRIPTTAANNFSNITQQIRTKTTSPVETTGPLVPLWVNSPEKPSEKELLFLRKVTRNETTRYQGFLIDWAKLESVLLEQIADLVTQASLSPVLDEAASIAEAGRMLATVPVSLSITPLRSTVAASTLPRWSLGVTWGALLIALIGFGFGFRAVIAYGEKRSRFASAVTHELRTPLTTFQLYSEMLADDMIADESKRAEYLETLRKESRRLSSVVENVLTYARVEDGRSTPRPVELSLTDLLERMPPELERRSEEVNARLTIEFSSEPDDEVRADPEAIGHIVSNLVDNACKYGCRESGSEIRVRAGVETQCLTVLVEDDGPGIPAKQRRAIFEPFDRAGRESSNVPGVGLGLSLSRSIARELGGELTCRATASGASFELRIRLS